MKKSNDKWCPYSKDKLTIAVSMVAIALDKNKLLASDLVEALEKADDCCVDSNCMMWNEVNHKCKLGQK